MDIRVSCQVANVCALQCHLSAMQVSVWCDMKAISIIGNDCSIAGWTQRMTTNIRGSSVSCVATVPYGHMQIGVIIMVWLHQDVPEAGGS